MNLRRPLFHAALGLILAMPGLAPAQTAPTIEGPPGPYVVRYKGPVNVSYKDGAAVVTFGEIKPEPDKPDDPVKPPSPPPPPEPQPAAPEVVGSAWLMAIYDEAAEPAYMPAEGDAYAKNREIVAIRRTAADSIASQWLAKVGLAAPAVVIVGRDGAEKNQALHSAPMPRSEAEFRVLIDQMKPAKPGR